MNHPFRDASEEPFADLTPAMRGHEGAEGAASPRLALPVDPTDDPGWRVVEEGFTPTREHEIESLFAVANGHTRTRASLAEGSAFSRPATFVAGVFTIDPQVPIPELAVMPDWAHLQVIVGGLDLRVELGELLEYRRVLDLRQGIFWREWRHRDAAGRITSLRFLRLALLADRHVLLQSVWLIPENYGGRVCLESTFGQSQHTGVPISSMVLESRSAPVARWDSGQERPSLAMACTTVSTNRDVTVAFARASQLWTEPGRLIEPTTEGGVGSNTERWEWDAEIGLPACLDRIVVPAHLGASPIHLKQRLGGWTRSLLVELSRSSTRIGRPGRLDGRRQAWWWRAMKRVTWLSALPSTNLSVPPILTTSRSQSVRAHRRRLQRSRLLGHRDLHASLLSVHPPAGGSGAADVSRPYAPGSPSQGSVLRLPGALFAWESADTGEETTPRFVLAPTNELIQIRTGEQEHHISAAIAYAVWQYWQMTGDDTFFLDAGAEIVLETARFWASRGQFETDGCYHIRHVIGPDEYHEGVDDNAYTDGMAKWNLERGVEVAQFLQERWPMRWRDLTARLALANQELTDWFSMAARMETGYHPETDLFEQFHGYFGLEDIDLAA